MTNTNHKPRIIVITGAESTGKSVLAKALARHFHAPWFQEFARDYVQKINHHYTIHDVLAIAKMQKTQMQAALKLKSEIVFFDTWLVITQIWLKMVYNDVPEWIPEMIKTTPIDLFLICDTDIPWEPDPVRENGGEMRIELSKIYQKTIEGYGYPFMIVKGEGENRTKNAIDLLNNFLL